VDVGSVVEGALEIEAVVGSDIGQAPNVFSGPGGDIGGDVMDLVFGAVTLGQGHEAADEAAFAVVERAQGDLDAIHEMPSLLSVSLYVAVVLRLSGQ
jgi:hypothetical protein